MLNIPDVEVEDLLLKLTFLPIETINEAMTEHSKLPDNRVTQKLLARTVTEMVHGKAAIASVLGATDAFFGIDIDKDLSSMSKEQFELHFKST